LNFKVTYPLAIFIFKIMNTTHYFITCCLLFFYSFPGQLQGQNLPGQDKSEINQSQFQNNLFLHFDKEHYAAGETIWFKAYLLNAGDFLPDSGLINLNIELFDFQGKPVLSRKYKISDGTAWGDIDIDSLMADGNYLLHAYTDVVADSFKNNFFQKYFYIENPIYSNRISNQEIKLNIQFNKQLNEQKNTYTLKFYPEGENLVAHKPNRVVVFAGNELGEGLPGSGKILDEKGSIVAEFITNEIGYAEFSFATESGKTYTSEFLSVNNEFIKGTLPEVIYSGFILNVHSEKESDRITFRMTSRDSKTGPFVLKWRRGSVELFQKLVNLEPDAEINIGIQKNELPAGIVHFELFDEAGELLFSRPFLVDDHKQPIIEINAQALQYENDRVMNLNLNLYDSDGTPVKGELSISVLAGDMSFLPAEGGILSYMLVGSSQENQRKLRENLFSQDDDEIKKQLDLIVLAGEYKSQKTINASPPDSIDKDQRKFGITIRGIAIDPTSNQPVSSVKLQLRYGIGVRPPVHTSSDDNGIFEFSNLDLPDSIKIEITSDLLSGGIRPLIKLLPDEVNEINYENNLKTKPQQITRRGSEWKRIRQPVAKSNVPVSLYGNPDQTIVLGDRIAYFNVLDLLQDRAVGLMITGNIIMFRGPSSITFSNEPLFIRDNIVVSRGEFLQQDPREIERIELFKGASAAFFGARGANGVILSYSKRGQAVKRPYDEFMVKGFSTPKEFILDKNLNKNDFKDGKVHTVLWVPDIKTDVDGKSTLRFVIIPGIANYKVIIQGISEDGGIISGDFLISN
jgi:hypothetical protein